LLASAVGSKAADAKTALTSAVGKGVATGKEAAEKAKAGAGAVERQLVGGLDADVEKALRQRYEKSAAMNKTVDDILKERYKPEDQRDRSVLRGL